MKRFSELNSTFVFGYFDPVNTIFLVMNINKSGVTYLIFGEKASLLTVLRATHDSGNL